MSNKNNIEGLGELRRGLNRIEDAVTAAAQEFSLDLAAAWKHSITNHKAIDSGDYRRSVGAHRISARSWSVDTSNNPNVNYSLIVESGVLSRDYPGRPVVADALRQMDSENVLEKRITEKLDEVLK